MKTFKTYSPLPASLRPCTLNCRRISEGAAAAAARQPEANTFNGFPLIEKICLHLLFSFPLRLGKRRRKRSECCELMRRRREERTLQMVSAVEKPDGGQGGNDNDKLFQQTNAIRG